MVGIIGVASDWSGSYADARPDPGRNQISYPRSRQVECSAERYTELITQRHNGKKAEHSANEVTARQGSVGEWKQLNRRFANREFQIAFHLFLDRTSLAYGFRTACLFVTRL